LATSDKYSRFGTRDDYTVSVRCIEEKGLVLLLASGRERSKANALQLNLQREGKQSAIRSHLTNSRIDGYAKLDRSTARQHTPTST
jgi:hypothetical protein